MRVLMLEAPESLLAERRRTGADRFDEVWEGVLHMVPPPSDWHQVFGTKLLVALQPIAEKKGLVSSYETGVFRPGAGETDYRQPDLVFSLPAQRTRRGIEGPAELVVEILSPGDESCEKLPFYAELGIREVLIVNPDTRDVELFVLKAGRLLPLSPDEKGGVRSQILDVSFLKIDGPKLRVGWVGGEAVI